MSWREITTPILMAIVLGVATLILINWRFQSNGSAVKTSKFVEHNYPWLRVVKILPIKDTMFVEVTAYSSEVSQTDSTSYLTAHQTLVAESTVACPRYIKFHTKVVIQGKTYECLDRMNIRYKDRFDIWFFSEKLAKAWGIRKLEVIIK